MNKNTMYLIVFKLQGIRTYAIHDHDDIGINIQSKFEVLAN